MKKVKSISVVGLTAFSLLLLTILVMTGQAWARESQDVTVVQAEASTEFRQEAVTLIEQGAVRFLSGPNAGEPLDIALAFIQANREALGLSESDLADVMVTDLYQTKDTGVTHIYLRQRYDDIEVSSANININIAADGSVINLGSRFVSNLAENINGVVPTLTAVAAVEAAAQSLKLNVTQPLVVEESLGGADQAVVLSDGGISLNSIPARLVYQPYKDSVHLAWNVTIYQLDALHWWDMQVDAATGEILSQDNWVDFEQWGSPTASSLLTGTYRVYTYPAESPNHVLPLPPADGRQLHVDPADPTASSFGWHDTNGANGPEFTTTQGNNVHAYTDTDANNAPDPGSSPDGTAALNFDFPIDLTQPPSAYQPAAVTNLFYWNNLIHDVSYLHGFDEPAGNFQENNYGNGGAGSDYVFAEAQDGSGVNNANFATPPDGQNPRMQMFIWTTPDPDLDGDLDNGIILHEYGHGISNRLTGGPANVGCLGNSEQMGEGWSDWMTLIHTMEVGDMPTDVRGIGTYALDEPTTGPGIRPAPYTTDLGSNAFTYGDIGGLAVPHGVGFVWATMLWEMNWGLIAEHGFNPNIYDDWTTGGNNLAYRLVLDGMKLQPCSPGFVDGRDAILLADQALTSGVNQCTIWEAFAKRGLGFSANQGSSGSTTDGTEAFDMPVACQTLGVTPATQNICVGDTALYVVDVGTAYTPPVTMSATGHPAGSTATFNPNPVNSVPSTTDLTIGNTAGAAAGSYNITIEGTDGVTTAMTIAGLEVYDAVPGSGPTLVTPPDGASSVSTSPFFQWTSVANSSQYLLEVATDAGFSSIVYTATVAAPDTSHATAVSLAPTTQHYWRVTAANPCGDGGTSAAFSFTTLNVICEAPNLNIPDNNPAGISSDMVIATNGTLTDLDISLDVTHTFVGDLIFTLEHVDTGTTATFYDRPGYTGTGFGCGGDDIDVIANDEGPDGTIESQCSNLPATSGNRVGGDPANSSLLAAFDGEDLSGTWRLTASDNAGADTGTFNEWCLLPATDPVGYSIDFDKTVGTDPTTCAATDTITLPYGGGDVTYCYNVTNTGTVTLTHHDLVDTELGVILDDFPYELASGDSVFVTETVNIAVTTVNTATWTATDNAETVARTDSATVNVEPPDPTIEVNPNSMASTQAPDSVITQTVTVGNIGTGDLDWSISETVAFVGQAAPPAALPTVANNVSADAAFTDYGVKGLTLPAPTTAPTASNAPAAVSVGGLTYYADRTIFDAANPGLPIEDFEDGIPGPGTITGCPAPFNETTNNGCFAPGAILPGISFQDDPLNSDGGGVPEGLVFIGSGAAGNPTDVIAANTFVDSFDIFFTEETNAAGMDLVSYLNGSSINITVYAADDTTILDTTTATASNTGIFWGVSANEPIGRIKIDSVTDQAEGVDNIAFGNAAICTNDDIPWVSVSPNTGSTAGGDSDDVQVVFDSTGLSAGNTYTGTLCITSNDDVNPVVNVPLTLTVVSPVYAVDIGPDSAVTALPGSTVTHTMWVTNNSNVNGVVSLGASGNSWNAAFSDNNFVLNVGEAAQIYAWVDIPAAAAGNSSDVATISASIGDASASATATTTAEAVYGVDVASDMSAAGSVGSSITYHLWVTNTGNTADTFDLTVSGNSWTTTPDSSSITLASGEGGMVMVTVDIPGNVTTGAMDTATVTATSQGDGSVSGSVNLTTTAEGNYLYLPVILKP